MRRKSIASAAKTAHSAMQLHSSLYNRYQPPYFISLLTRIVISIVGVTSAFVTMQGFYNFPLHLQTVLTVCILSCVLFGVLFGLPRPFRSSIILLLLGLEVIIYRHWDAFLAGYRAVCRVMSAKIQGQERVLDSLTSTAAWNEQQCTTFFVCGVLFLLAMCVCFFTVAHPNFPLCFLFTFPFLEVGLYFGYETDPMAVFGLVGFWLALLSMHCANTLPISNRKSAKQGRMRFYDTPIPHEPMAAFLLLLTLLGCLLTGIATRDYVRSPEIDNRRSEIKQAISSFSFEDVTGLMGELPQLLSNNVLTNEIDLTKRGDVQFNGSIVMDIDMEMTFAPCDLYLRGTCRSTYTGLGWTVPTRAYRAQRDTFDMLTHQGIYPQTVSYRDDAIALMQAEPSADHNTPYALAVITARNKELVNYLPYQAVFPDVLAATLDTVRYDSELRLKDQQCYNVALDLSGMPNWQSISFSRASMRSPNPTRAAYEDFATEFYAQNEDSSPEWSAIEREFLSTLQPYDTYEDALSQIRDFIWARADYTLHPGNTPRDADFAAYFLTQSHAGYCAHYASAAVLLCRAAGIPARYAQGYVISETDFEKIPPDGVYHIELPDYRAHAWAEIFIPTIGWMPYEFTEGIIESWHADSTPELPIESDTAQTTTSTTTTTTTAISSTQTSHVTTSHMTSVPQGTATPNRMQLTRSQRILLLTLLLLCAVLILGIIGVRMYHAHVIEQRKAAMNPAHPNRAADAGYQFLLQLLQMQGIRQGSRSHEAFAAYAQEHCTLLPAGTMQTVLSIQQAVIFSGDTVSQDDAQIITQTATNLAAQMYQQASTLQKLRLRWISHIVP